MNTQVAIAEPRPQLASGGKARAIIPQTMEEAFRLAKAVCMAGMAPKGLDTPEKAMIAIMHGLEIGLAPMTALQRIAVVNGRPTIWGDGAMSLVRGSGVCEWITEEITGVGDSRTATCEAKRKGDPKTIRRTFSVGEAKKAGLWGKAGPWTQYETRMLQMRARGFALRDGFADVLGGLYLKEEMDDASDVAAVKRPPPPPALPATRLIAHDAETGEVTDNSNSGPEPDHPRAAASPLATNAVKDAAAKSPPRIAVASDDFPGDRPDAEAVTLLDIAREHAMTGFDAFSTWQAQLSPAEKKSLGAHMPRLLDAAAVADGEGERA